jgi:hypothetical protein
MIGELDLKKLIALMFAGMFLFSACGPEPEPTMSAEEVQGTAVAAAWTMVAETQAAIPTATPIPPTDTPVPTLPPTATPILLPTQPISVLPTATQTSASVDLCSDLKHIIPADAAGPTTTIRIVNEYKVPATISIYLNKTVFGECGYRSYTLSKNGDTVQTLPQGCYSAWAWSTDSKETFNAAGYGLCANNSDKWTMVIRGERIIMLPP